jgi:hypothetical protein
MLELVTRNRFRLPVNPMDVGLSWGRRGFSCAVARELGDLAESEPKPKRRVAPRPARQPAQTVMSAGILGPYRPPTRPKSMPPIAVVREEHLLDADFVAVALRGGLEARVNNRRMELFPGDEIQVVAGAYCEISVVSAQTRWLFGYRE